MQVQYPIRINEFYRKVFGDVVKPSMGVSTSSVLTSYLRDIEDKKHLILEISTKKSKLILDKSYANRFLSLEKKIKELVYQISDLKRKKISFRGLLESCEKSKIQDLRERFNQEKNRSPKNSIDSVKKNIQRISFDLECLVGEKTRLTNEMKNLHVVLQETKNDFVLFKKYTSQIQVLEKEIFELEMRVKKIKVSESKKLQIEDKINEFGKNVLHVSKDVIDSYKNEVYSAIQIRGVKEETRNHILDFIKGRFVDIKSVESDILFCCCLEKVLNEKESF